MVSTDIVTMFFLTLTILIISLFNNPLNLVGKRIVESARIMIGPYIHVLQKENDRLFVINPEQSIIYNTAGALYYYFEGGASRRFCPQNEHAIVRIKLSDINLINENGTYNITCTTTSSMSMYDHFLNDASHWYLPIYISSYTIIDILNELIKTGMVELY